MFRLPESLREIGGDKMDNTLKKALETLFAILVVMATIAGGMAYTDWRYFGISGLNHTSTTLDNALFAAKGVSPSTFTGNCTLSASVYGPLTDPIYHLIWTTAAGTLTVYDKQCNLVEDISLNGTLEGNPVLIQKPVLNYTSPEYPYLVVPVKTPDGTLSVMGIYYNGLTLNEEFEVDLGASSTYSSGVWCDPNSHICALQSSDGNIKRINMNTGTYLNHNNSCGPYQFYSGVWHTSGIFSYNPAMTNSLQQAEGVTGGDIDKDGNSEALFYNTYPDVVASKLYWCVQLYDINSDVVQINNTHFSIVCGFSSPQPDLMRYYGAPYTMGQVGNPASHLEIFEYYESSCDLTAYRYARVWDENFNNLNTFLSYGATPGADSGDNRLTNFISGDINADGQFEYCVVVHQGFGNQTPMLKCFDGSHTLLSNCSVASIFATDMQRNLVAFDWSGGGSGLEFATPTAIFDENCNLEGNGTFGYTNPSTYPGMLMPADVNDDNKTDIAYGDQNTGRLIYTYGSAGTSYANCSADKDACNSPCMMADSFSYDCTFQSMGWSLIPGDPSAYPVYDNMCEAGDTDFYYSNAPTWWANVITEEFNITIPTQYGYGQADLSIFDSTDSDTNKPYILTFIPTLVTDYDLNISYYNVSVYETVQLMDIHGVYSEVQENVCPGCFGLGEKKSIKVTMYMDDAYGKSFLNTTTNTTQLILPNTLAINIGGPGGITYYNVPQYQTLDPQHTNTLSRAHFWLREGMCIDDFKVYGGFSFGSFDLSHPDLVNTSQVEGCWNIKTGEFQCWVGGCQDCCELFPDNSVRVKDFGCVLGKSVEYQLDKVKFWILDNIIIFIIVLLLFILLIPIILRALEIARGFGGNRGY